METPTTDKSKQEVCRIHLAIPIDTDEEALRYKREIQKLIEDKPKAAFHFAISNLPSAPT